MLVGLLVCELGVRLLVPQPLLHDPDAFVADPVLLARLKPGFRDVVITTEFRSTWDINAEGHRGPRAGERGAAGPLIAALGDSFTFGYGVEEDEAWPRRVEALLGGQRAEVINLGVGGYGTWQEAALLEETCARHRPALALVAFYVGNDPSDNSRNRPPATPPAGPAPAAPGLGSTERLKRWMGARSQLYNLVADRGDELLVRMGLRRLVYPFEVDLLRSDVPADVERAWEDTAAALGRLADAASRCGTRLLLVIVPMKHQVSDAVWARLAARYSTALDRFAPQARIADLAARAGIESLDLLPGFREAAAREGDGAVFYWPRDQHWTARGHDEAARLIANHLRAQQP